MWLGPFYNGNLLSKQQQNQLRCGGTNENGKPRPSSSYHATDRKNLHPRLCPANQNPTWLGKETAANHIGGSFRTRPLTVVLHLERRCWEKVVSEHLGEQILGEASWEQLGPASWNRSWGSILGKQILGKFLGGTDLGGNQLAFFRNQPTLNFLRNTAACTTCTHAK